MELTSQPRSTYELQREIWSGSHRAIKLDWAQNLWFRAAYKKAAQLSRKRDKKDLKISPDIPSNFQTASQN